MRPGKVHGGQLNVKESLRCCSDCDARRAEKRYPANRNGRRATHRSGRERGNLNHSQRHAALNL
jgi:hypothetical protein